MSVPVVNPNAFTKIVRDETTSIANEMGWNYHDALQRGLAFQLWVARLFCEYQQGWDTDPDESLLQVVMQTKDLKADIVLEDTARRHLLIAQCKFVSLSDRPPINDEQVNDFFNRHKLFMDRKFIRGFGSESVSMALGDYSEKIKNGWAVDYYFVSTGSATPKITSIAEKCNSEYAREGSAVRCFVYDFLGLRDLHVQSLSLDQSAPEKISIQLPSQWHFVKKEPYKTLVAAIKGNPLRNLYNEKGIKESLFAWNIRGYLGSRGINTGISRTAEDRSSDFFYFNNGITAICTEFELTGNTLTAVQFQVINEGADDWALVHSKPNDELYVLFRLIETPKVSTSTGVNRDIVRFNNTQNAIKVSDFRSNDPIQVWLEKEFDSLKVEVNGSLPLIRYSPKRSAAKRRKAGRVILLEELAKIRYSYLVEPTITVSSPKDLWTQDDENSKYAIAFGEGDPVNVPTLWTKTAFSECLLAIALYLKIETETKNEAKATKELGYFKRLRFHALALAGIYVRGKTTDAERTRLLRDKAAFNAFWEAMWDKARMVIIDAVTDALNNNTSMYAFYRSGEQWERMQRKFILFQKISR